MAKEETKSTPVRLIREEGKAALVEWIDEDGRYQRAILPSKLVTDGVGGGWLVAQTDLDAGMPYGVPWAELITIEVTPQIIEHELRKAGLWTFQDLQANPNVTLGALVAAYGVSLSSLLRLKEKS
jgi:hypothetical protein